ncbi:MAG: PAS domain-containing protein [Chroococcidiopsidaceae cyanobacterium CP_BM_RX_35]|nr:PAS domain-containing protein [Chroococcidiopsidaceae cyanobacterium CP_BM_RX_35]
MLKRFPGIKTTSMTPEALFFTLSADLLYILGTDGYFKRVNPAFEKLLGRTAEELLTQPFAEFIHPDDRAATLNEIEKAKTGTPIALLENRFECIDGSYRWLDWSIHPVLSEDVLYGVGRDITERKQIELELHLNRDRLDLAIKASELGTFYCDLPLDRIIWNDKCKEHFWLPPEAEVNFELFYSIIHPDDRERTRESVEACVYERKAYDIEYRTVAPDGQTRWVRAIGNCFYGESNNPIRFDGITIDVTDRKQAESEREKLLASERAARSEVERASQLKDEFLLTLSHELRTPLNAILGWSQLLRKGTMDGQKMAQGLDTIERNVRVQAQLIDDLLDMSRIISGKIRLNVQRVELGSVIEAAVETVRLSAEVKAIRLQQVLDPLAGIVSGDPARLQQIVWNLLSNAIKFTPKGGRVQVVLERVNSHLEISVIDTGQGIKPEFLPHVFDRFRQADASTTRNHGGLGLGLSIARSLTELHGGSIRVKSAGEGKGATFIVSLPLVVVHPETVEPDDFDREGAISTSGDYRSPVLNGVKVLVVDDEPDARELIKIVLEECHAEVVTAASTQEALEVLKRERPDVLVSDIGMPQADGYQLIRQVRNLDPNRGGIIPAVALTAYARAEDRKRALLSGYQMHISKPVEPSELIVIVASLTSLIPHRREGQL